MLRHTNYRGVSSNPVHPVQGGCLLLKVNFFDLVRTRVLDMLCKNENEVDFLLPARHVSYKVNGCTITRTAQGPLLKIEGTGTG